MGTNPTFVFENNEFLSYFKIEETTKNLNQVGWPRDLNPGPPECESRALPRSHLAQLILLLYSQGTKLKRKFCMCLYFYSVFKEVVIVIVLYI